MHPAESTHWYDREGKPAYTVIGKNGRERPTTLRDARGLGLFPSVSTILRECAKPGLERWKQEQVLHAALTLPKIEGEIEKDYLDRIMRDSQEQGKKAAALGTAIHAAIEGRDTFGPYGEFVIAAQGQIYDWIPGLAWKQEQSFASPLGFGGKVDDNTTNALVDYKTTDKPLEDLDIWDDHKMQLGAYRMGLDYPIARCAIVYVSRLKPEARLIEIPQVELIRGWDMFRALLNYWYAKTGLQHD